MKIFLYFLLATAVFASCHSSDKNNVLPIDSMKIVMLDLMRMDQYYITMQSKDSSVIKRKENLRLYQEVFALHHITKPQFDKSMKYYESHPIEFKILVDSLSSYTEKERNRVSENHGQAKP